MRKTAENEGWLPLHNALQAIIKEAEQRKFNSTEEYVSAVEQAIAIFSSANAPEN